MTDVIASSPLDVCELWLTRAGDALAACPDSEPITVAYVAAGAAAWDTCCGVLIAAPERVFRSAIFPNDGVAPDGCETYQLALDVVLMLLRCVPTLDDRGRAPTAKKLGDAYSKIIRDAAIVWDALNGELPEGWERANLDQAYIGAQGGCIGVETRVTIGLPQDEWCPCPEVTP